MNIIIVPDLPRHEWISDSEKSKKKFVKSHKIEYNNSEKIRDITQQKIHVASPLCHVGHAFSKYLVALSPEVEPEHGHPSNSNLPPTTIFK